MSNPSHTASSTEYDASALVTGARRVAIISGVITVAIVSLITSIAVFVAPADKPSGDMTPQGVAARIAKVGAVTLQVDTQAQGPRTGEQVYTAQCSSCHASGALNAPKFSDKAAWGARISSGLPALIKSALKGKGAMPAQGGADFSDEEVSNAVAYLANAGGAKFAESAAKAAK